jgi:nucleoid-associated protein YgaU
LQGVAVLETGTVPFAPASARISSVIFRRFPKALVSPRADSRALMKLMNSSAPVRSSALPLCIARVGAGVLCIGFMAAVGARAQDAPQDLAEAARQQRARKAAQGQSPSQAETHIYTNEDLQRSRILIEEDGARVASRKKSTASPAATTAERKAPAPSDATNASSGESLGAVARRYRREKSEREARQASAIPPASQFHLEVPAGSLAEVAPSVKLHATPHAAPHVAPYLAPQVAPRRASSFTVSVLPSASAKSGASALALRRDPFSRPVAGLAGKHFDAETAISAPPAVRLPASPKSVTPSFAATKSTPVNGSSVSIAPVVAARPVVNARTPSGLDVEVSLAAGTVTVRAGDSLWKLSRRYSGSAVRWPEWLRHNPGLGDPRSLRVGAILVVPPRADGSPPGSVPALRPVTRTIVVRSGDSLWKISVERYGDGARWPCLARANTGLPDASMIFPGQRLLLPAACSNPTHP